MKDFSFKHLYGKLNNKRKHSPLKGLIELTYRCALDCVHCYCKGSEDLERELSTLEWKRILDQIHREGCLFLTFSGGDPLIRKDFSELYSYAKKKGFFVHIYSSGQNFGRKIISLLKQSPPYSIEITLNGITKKTYESITNLPGSFDKIIHNIKLIKKTGLPLLLKTNSLRQNQNEVHKVKAFADNLLGKSKGKYHFKYDAMIYPRLNGNKEPLTYRLSFDKIEKVKKNDPDIWDEYQECLNHKSFGLRRNKAFLYNCNAALKNFFINPYGRLKFCMFSEKFSVDLKSVSFRDGFYHVLPAFFDEKFKTGSKCKDCQLRPICPTCPARAYLETGDEEAPVQHYCEIAKGLAARMKSK